MTVAAGENQNTDDLRPEDVQASFCHVLVDEWITHGVSYAALAPGSRSTPMALALMHARDSGRPLVVDIFHDERSAGFAALGAALVSNGPSIALCTSGTAAAHFHAAVIEADLSAVPLIVCTADRPAELRDVGAPQTVDQTKMYGNAVRWFHDPGVPSSASAGSWRSLAARIHWIATGSHPGPVHLNMPFREPLVGTPVPSLVQQTLVSNGTNSRERHLGRRHLDPDVADRIASGLSERRGVIVAGRGCGDPERIDALANALGWPVFAEPRAGCGAGSRTILHFDALVRAPGVVDVLHPEIVLRLGEPPASKVLAQWVTARSARQIHVVASGQMFDPDHRLDLRLEVDIDAFCDDMSRRVTPFSDAEWFGNWMVADRQVRSLLDSFTSDVKNWSALTATRSVIRHLPAGSHLVLSSSMPIRDAEWFAGDCSHVTVHANRGANGIDGVIATSVGVSHASGQPTFVLLGDVAAIHDASTLLTLAGRDLDLRVVVINNDGGGIFHHLPQATTVGADTFETIYGTPHGVDFAAVAQALRIPTSEIDGNLSALGEALALRGPSVTHIRTNRENDVRVHRLIQARVAGEIRLPN